MTNSNKDLPLVSVIIPVYNGANYLSQAIESVLAQTYQNIEIIVVNDGSTDETDQIAKSYGSRIRYFKKRNGGVSSALNYGIEQMKGTYFSWLSHDDTYMPEKIEAEIKIIPNHKKPCIVFSDFNLIDEKNTITATTNFYNQFDDELLSKDIYPAIKGCVNGDTILIHRDIFKEQGLFDKSLETSGDSDFWLRIFPHYEHYFINKPLINYRIHPNQDTQKHPHYKSQSDDIAVKKIRTLSSSHVNAWHCSLFRIYMELYIQFKNVGLPKSTKLAYSLGKKQFTTDTPTFSIIIPNPTNEIITTLENSNYGDYEVFANSIDIDTSDFRFNKNKKTNSNIFIKTNLSKCRGRYIVILKNCPSLSVDWLMGKYKELRSNNNTTIIVNEKTPAKRSPHNQSYIKKLYAFYKANGKKRTIKAICKKIIRLERKILPKRLSTKNTIFFSTATNDYISKSATSLLSIRTYLPKAKLFIISRNISSENKSLLQSLDIGYLDIDLRGKFYRHWAYPPECYYIFAGPSYFKKLGYNYSVYIDGDILCCANPIKKIKNVTGVAGVAVGNCRGVFLDDFDKLKKIFSLSEEQVNRKRIASGIVYFNNKLMEEKNLLDTASNLFSKCLEHQAPRKGDDSLFTLIQLLSIAPQDILYLDNSYNYMPTLFGKELPNNLVFLHFAEYKPWSNYNNETRNIKRYIQKWLKIYHRVSPNKETIEKRSIITHTNLYNKEKFKQNNKKQLVIFVSEDDALGIHNFGDEIPKYLIPAIFGYKIIPTTNINEADLLSVGSVLFELPNLNKEKHIKCWGSGYISEEPLKNENKLLKQVSFSAVRGKTTLSRIKKVYRNCNIPLGDPGILVNLIYPAANIQELKNKIGVVPHYIDANNPIVEKLRQDSRFYIIDPLDPPEKVANEISSCKYILSSSLHGLIFADSYGIPNAHVSFSNKVYGGEYKFKDYCSAFNKTHIDLDTSKIFDLDYQELLLKQYQPISNLEEYQKNLIDSFPF